MCKAIFFKHKCRYSVLYLVVSIEQVSFSMLEIYNEQVRDLLNPASLKVKGGLKVRQHPNKGFHGKYKYILMRKC